MRTASAEAVSPCRTFGDEAWSQQLVSPSGKEVVTKLYLPELEEGAYHHLSIDDK
jgi:hypothetical protein